VTSDKRVEPVREVQAHANATKVNEPGDVQAIQIGDSGIKQTLRRLAHCTMSRCLPIVVGSAKTSFDRVTTQSCSRPPLELASVGPAASRADAMTASWRTRSPSSGEGKSDSAAQKGLID